MAYPVADPYRAAITSSVAVVYSVSASLAGALVSGAQDLRPTGGTITDTSRPGVRRSLNLQLAPTPGLFDKLSPIGTTLTVTARVRFTDQRTVSIPMGVFDVDRETLGEGGGPLSLTAPDKWARIQRARFIRPQASTRGIKVVDQIAVLIQGALGGGEPVNIMARSTAKVGALVWEKDRDKAIIDLARGAGVWVFFDRFGVATIADIPTVGKTADWVIAASSTGVLTELDRERSRAQTRNVVVVESSASDTPAFPTQVVWDKDVRSPTYAGTNPFTNPSSAGPFGIVTYYYDTPLPLTALEAYGAGFVILSRLTGLASSVSLGQVPNPAVDAFDVLDVLPPRERHDLPRVVERHVADTVTHPLTLGPAQQIEGRSTRSEEME